MPLTPDEAAEKNKDKHCSQFDLAMQELGRSVEAAIECYSGEHIYVGLPGYLEYRIEADVATDARAITLKLIDRKLHERFGPFGWKIGIVTNAAETRHWAKLIDAREPH